MSNSPINKLTRLQLDAICKMQELIELAKAGKTAHRTYSHKEFVNAVKGRIPDNTKYDNCSETAKQKWLSVVNNMKKSA